MRVPALILASVLVLLTGSTDVALDAQAASTLYDGLEGQVRPAPAEASSGFHDDGVKYCNNFGPGGINITDNGGVYMWVVCEIGNFSGHNDKVSLTIGMTGEPACVDVDEVLATPGQHQFSLLGGGG